VTPQAAARVEPLRDIPGLRRKERTWRDEVLERVKSRRQKRASAGLPLFDHVEPPQVAQAPSRVKEASITLPLPPAPATSGVEPKPSEAFATMRQSEDELGDLPLNTDDTQPNVAAREREDGALPRATRRSLPSLDDDALPHEPSDEPELELPPLATEAPPLERPAFPLERAQAAAVDTILFAALGVVVLYFTGRAARVDVTGLAPSWPGLALYLGLLALFYAAYFTGTTGQTPGKLMTGLRVVGATGRPPSYPRAMARALLGVAGIVLAGAFLVPMAFDPARRTLHDRLFRTRVVRS